MVRSARPIVFVTWIGIVFSAVLNASCGGAGGGDPPSVPTLTSIAIKPNSLDLGVGMSTQLTATGTYSDSTTADITPSIVWSAREPTVATVSANGTVTGVSPGTASVVAASGAVQATLSLQILSHQWTRTGSLTAQLSAANTTAVRLLNGKVLMLGGTSAQLYDPASGVWSAASSIPSRIQFPVQIANAIVLQNGKVLVTFGVSSTATEIYDPVADNWTSSGNTLVAMGAPMVLLQDGKVLMAGGVAGPAPYSGAEIYDPNSGTWSATGSLAYARAYFTLTRLDNGKVLATGGNVINATTIVAAAEIYDPAAGTWTTVGNMPTPVYDHTATLLKNGQVLVAGGYDTFGTGLGSTAAELYDPSTGVWSMTGPLIQSRIGHTATLLDNGQVMVAGGSQSGTLAEAELYDPLSGTWSTTGSMSTARSGFSSTLLQNGTVLAMGGSANGGPLLSTELYWP